MVPSVLDFEAITIYNNKLWFSELQFNAIFSCDIETGVITYETMVPEEDPYAQRLIGNMLVYRDMLVMIPMSSKKLWLYSPKSKEWRGVEINPVGYVIKDSLKYSKAFIIDDNLIMIGYCYPAIVKVSLIDYQVTYVNALFKSKELMDADSDWPAITCGKSILQTPYVFIPLINVNSIIKYNSTTDEQQLIEIGEKDYKYKALEIINGDYWILPRWNKPIVVWDGRAIRKKIDLPDILTDNELKKAGRKYAWTYVIDMNDKIVIAGDKRTYTVDKDGVIIDELIEDARYIEIEGDWIVKKYRNSDVFALFNKKGNQKNYSAKYSMQNISKKYFEKYQDIKEWHESSVSPLDLYIKLCKDVF